ncbi:MAG: hypothetical protein NT060_00845 [Candidatus Omnitrophica bacterium]|nr:hypothetical protein [Candidatus Omnitrophota bacterium]
MLKKYLSFAIILFSTLVFTSAFAADTNSKPKLILMISEQNIESPQKCWWASEVDLSVTEAAVAQNLLTQGYEIIEPSVLNKTITQNPAFRIVDIGEQSSTKLGRLSAADYVILGKAIASSGGNVPQSTMRSCFANITAKVIRVKDGKVIAYLDATGNSAHMDVITGGKEALKNAGEDLSAKIIAALAKEGGK